MIDAKCLPYRATAIRALRPLSGIFLIGKSRTLQGDFDPVFLPYVEESLEATG